MRLKEFWLVGLAHSWSFVNFWSGGNEEFLGKSEYF